MTHSSDSPLLRLPNTFHAFYGGFPSLHKAQKAAIIPILSGHNPLPVRARARLSWHLPWSSTETIKGFLYCVGTLIIDEVHPLVHQYRGRHLAFLLSRLERRSGQPLQKIAMSATIADAGSVIGFFGFKADTSS